MQEYKVAINNITKESRLLLFEGEELVGTTLEEDEFLVNSNGYVGLIKPYWDGNKWVEGLTEEEIKALENKNKPKTEENLIDKLILDNINMQMQIDSLIESQLGGN